MVQANRCTRLTITNSKSFPKIDFPALPIQHTLGWSFLSAKWITSLPAWKPFSFFTFSKRQKAKLLTINLGFLPEINLFFGCTCYPSELLPFLHCEHLSFQPTGPITFLTSHQILMLPSLSILQGSPPLSSHSKLYLLGKHEFKIPEPPKKSPPPQWCPNFSLIKVISALILPLNYVTITSHSSLGNDLVFSLCLTHLLNS